MICNDMADDPAGASGGIEAADRGVRDALALHLYPAVNCAANFGVTLWFVPASMAVVDPIEIVVAHGDRATLRLGDAFLKIDADHTRADVEVEEWPSRRSRPQVLWRHPR